MENYIKNKLTKEFLIQEYIVSRLAKEFLIKLDVVLMEGD